MNHKIRKATASVIMTALLLGGMAVASQDAQAAAKKVSITKKAKVTVGKIAKIKLKNNKKKVKWKITNGKKLIKLTKKSKTSATVKGVKAGTAKVQAVVGKKKYSCTVKVSAAKKQTETAANPSAPKTPVSSVVPSGNSPVTTKPSTAPSGNTTSNPSASATVIATPSGDTPEATPTASPSGDTPATAAPTPTVYPENVPTIMFDGREQDNESLKAIWAMEKKEEPYKVIIKEGCSNFPCDGFIHMIAVTLPDDWTVIETDEFIGCNSLTSITIPDSVTTIKDFAFAGCRNLKSINLPANLTTIEFCAFNACNSLEKIDLPEGVTNIEECAFFECTSLTSIEIPASVTNIEGGLFGACSNLATIKVAEENQVYDSRDNCNAIIKTATNELISTCEHTKLPSGIKDIANSAYRGRPDLTSIEIPEGATHIGASAFEGCENLTSIKIPESVTDIGEYAFFLCEKLTEISIPNGVTIIRDDTFSGCSSLTDITLPSELTRIEGIPFYGCDCLTHLTIPSKLTSIEPSSLNGCDNLTSISWLGQTYKSAYAFLKAFLGDDFI